MRTLVSVWFVIALILAGPSPDIASWFAPTTSARLAATVFGYVWNASNEPIGRAAVQLRNVSTGEVEARARTGDGGEFTFAEVKGGAYVVEYVDAKEQVIAVGHVFWLGPEETVATFIRLAGRGPRNLLGTAGTAAAVVVASAATLGVTAVAPGPRPVSPEG